MKLPFEEIYCLHLVEDKNRYDSILNEINRIELENNIEFWYTSKKPINNEIGDNLESLHTRYYDKRKLCNQGVYGSVFDCAYNHYSIIKQAYLRGVNSILILEDDIKFNDDNVIIKDIIDNMPNDYDVLKLYNTNNYNWGNKSIDCKNYFIKLDKTNFYNYSQSTLCYALSKKGMEVVINEYERSFMASDLILDNIRSNDTINFYTLKINNFVKPNTKLKSNIIYK